jgi:hypothetical protein
MMRTNSIVKSGAQVNPLKLSIAIVPNNAAIGHGKYTDSGAVNVTAMGVADRGIPGFLPLFAVKLRTDW